jgi:hypothetical protein
MSLNGMAEMIGPENLFLRDPHIVADVCEHAWRHEIALRAALSFKWQRDRSRECGPW